MVIRTSGGTLGGYSEGMIQNCLDFPFHQVYNYKRYCDIFQQTAALLYAFITFHPFTDGNKRSALVVMQLFLTMNGYSFSYPDDTFGYVKAIASRRIRGNKRISKWLRKNIIKSKVYKHQGRRITFPDKRVYEILNQLAGVPIRVKRV